MSIFHKGQLNGEIYVDFQLRRMLSSAENIYYPR